MTIRSARESDAATVASLSTQLGYPASPEQIGDRLASIGERVDQEVLVAEQAGTVVGWVHVFRSDRLETDPFAEIGGLVVDRSHRGRGVGAALLDAAEAWAAARGLRAMRIRSNIVRDEARRFYENRGYTCSKTQAVFGKPLG